MSGKYLFCDGIFYPYFEKELYEQAGSWPAGGVDVDEEIREKFFIYPEGKCIGADGDGYPEWVNLPPPTHEEAVRNAEEKKKQLISSANSYMNSKQWPGKAAIGRLNGEGLALYNTWLDYLDALEYIDVSGAPDIEWPGIPG